MPHISEDTEYKGKYLVWLTLFILSFFCLFLPVYAIELSTTNETQVTTFEFKPSEIIVKNRYAAGSTQSSVYQGSNLSPVVERLAIIGLLFWINAGVATTCLAISSAADRIYPGKLLKECVPMAIKQRVQEFGIERIFKGGGCIMFISSVIAMGIIFSLPRLISSVQFSFISGFIGSATISYSGYYHASWGPGMGMLSLFFLLVIAMVHAWNFK